MSSVIGRAWNGVAHALELKNPCRTGTGKFTGNDHWQVVQVAKSSGWVELTMKENYFSLEKTQMLFDSWAGWEESTFETSFSSTTTTFKCRNHAFVIKQDSSTREMRVFLRVKRWNQISESMQSSYTSPAVFITAGTCHYDLYTDLLDTSTAVLGATKKGDLYNWGWNYDSPGISSSTFDPVKKCVYHSL